MQEKKMVLSAVGPDRPGLVKQIAEMIHSAGGNLEDSRMAILAGDFAQLVLFSGSEETVEKIATGVLVLQRELHLSVHIKEATPPKPRRLHEEFQLNIAGVDQPGIVHQVTEVLASLQINLAAFESRLSPAAFHGTPMFSLQAMLQVSTEAQLDALNKRLDNICQRLNLTFDLAPIQAA